MSGHDCPHCGAPVGDDGRYERGLEAPFVTDAPRYERRQLVTNVTQELERVRAMPPVIGSRRWYQEQTGHGTGCVMCGGELPANSGINWKRVARHRFYCSDACRQRAYRLRKASVTNVSSSVPS